MIGAYLVDLGSCFDLDTARTEAARLAVEELWSAVPDGADRFSVSGFLRMRSRVADELGPRVGASGVTLAAVSRLLEEADAGDEALALSVDAMYRSARDRAAKPFPSAPAVLAELSSRHRVGLVAVGTVDWRDLGISTDTVLVPRAMGLHRAEPVLVARAAGRLGCAVDELVVVAPEGSPLIGAATESGAQTLATGAGGIGNEKLT